MAEYIWFQCDAVPEIGNAYLAACPDGKVRMMHFLSTTDSEYEFGLSEDKRFMARNTFSFLNEIEHTISISRADWHVEQIPFVITKAYKDWNRGV